MPDETGSGSRLEQALAVAEKIHETSRGDFSVCALFQMSHDAYHVLAEHGATIAELCREARRRAH